MSPLRFRQVRNVFEAALERDTVDRRAFVAEACQYDSELHNEVLRLLEAREATVTKREDQWTKLARTDPSSREGRRVGNYEILRELGRGGMGTVYLARRADESFHKNVAIKVLRPDVASSDIVRRFQQEREILAQLDHPNIARLLEAGYTEDALPYFVMEYVEGRCVTEYADDQRLSTQNRIRLFGQVCDAVHYAHQRNVIHRDFKPSNIMVTADSQVKLLDFGIARLVEQNTKATTLTVTGMWLMTPEYASPEQFRGEVVGRASDVYSLAVILFVLLTGHRPYRLRSRIFHEIVRVVCEEAPTRPSIAITFPVEATTADGQPTTLPPETAGRFRQTSLDDLRRQLSGDLDNILLMALAKHAEDRYPSALQLRSDLDRHLNGEPVWARRDSHLYRAARRVSRHWLIILLTTVSAVATGSITLHWSTLAWAAGAAALIGVWRAATDREIGRKLAQPWIPAVLVTTPILALGVGTIYTSDKWLNIIVTDPLFLPVSTLILFGWWPLVRRRSGPLILKLERMREGWIVAPLCISILTAAWIAKLLLHQDFSHKDVLLTAFFVPYTFFIYKLVAIREVRRDGIIAQARLIRWSRIASWIWADRGSEKVLILHLYRRIHFLPPVRIDVVASQQARVESILARQLGECPPL